jgi:threonyl-tRNA synthetase
MADVEQQILDAGAKVRDLKIAKAPKEEVQAAVAALLALKATAGVDVNAGSNNRRKTGKEKEGPAAGPRAEMTTLPDYIGHRMQVWDECVARRAVDSPPSLKPITITLPDGKTCEGKAGETTPMSIAESISKQMAGKMVISKVNGQTHDLQRPIMEDCTLELMDFDTPDGQYTFWHSSAHVLGQAIELTYPDAQLCIGPPIDEGGFYYDVHLDKDNAVSPEHFKGIEKIISKVQGEKQPFERLELTKQEAKEMFKTNPFKLEIITNKIPDGERCTAYRCGPLIDLCRGPHVPSTGVIKAFSVTKNSSAYWLGKAENASLQRVYGISFPDKKKLKEYEEIQRLAEERDHRKVGLQQKLFFFHELSPGSCFFLPHGTRLYNKLQNFIRDEYWKRGYDEVISPNVFNVQLWKTSGHWQNYQENMFSFEVEGQTFAMKPMNCPGHCLMFGSTLRSYRELPVRYADFGVLHRNELSGALTGLTRVRRFQQDDAHIFCRQDQIGEEVMGVLDMLQHCYGIFGFTFSLCLSTRPEKFLGEIAMWDQAEKALADTLDKFGQEWSINPADGAFYGPKIDIQLTDALKRKHQCATIQLDFQLPLRFGLQYKSEKDGFEVPVIVHRAILGSVERMFAVLLEHTGGKWPFWLNPRQISIVPVHDTLIEYSREVRDLLHNAGFYVELDESSKQLKKKVRDAQLSQFNFILVLGAEERDAKTVNVRFRDHPDDKEVWTQDEMLVKLKALVDTHK